MGVTSAVLSFAVIAGFLTILPGLDTALVLRAAITQSKRHAFATALGISTGALIWGAAAAVGISALLTTSHLAYVALRLAGAAYLLWFGGTMLLRTWKSRRDGATPLAVPETVSASAGGPAWAWTRGVMTNLLNPKIGVFYAAMLPQFIPQGVPHLPMGLLLAFVHDLEGMVWFTLLIFGTQLVRGWLSKAAVQRAMDRITGTVLIGFGIKLALSE
jgi:threonine/homoserine/homoserine lactone efflux protein